MANAKKCDRCGKLYESSLNGGTEVDLTISNGSERTVTFWCGSMFSDLDNCSPTYVRMKFHGNIIIMPVRFNRFCIETSYEAFPTGTLEFIALGSTIIEDTKISGSEY